MAFTTIDKSTGFFNTLLYSGNSSTRSLTGVGFEPSFVWIKERTSTSDHMLFDQVRGVENYISSNLANAEQTSASMLTAFDSDGFSLGSGNDVNDSGQTYVSWNWKGNGVGSSNGDGSITTTYTSANTTNGVSIIKYTGNGSDGATIGHGLGVAPTYLIAKKTSGSSESWYVGSSGLTSWDYKLYLDTADAQSTNTPPVFGGTAPTTTLITLGGGAYPNPTNASGQTYIMYAFAPVTGFSSFGTYIGNGSADGPFVYTGFKPAFVLGKNSTVGSQHWFMNDNKRLGYNGSSAWIKADSNSAELTNLVNCDFLSNGFKLRNNNDIYNDSGETFIYMAFAEAPLVGSNDIPANAR